jgi:hypothetical protein
MAQMGHTDPSMTLGLCAKAVRNGRRSARSRRRLEELEWAPTGTSAPAGTGDAVDELAA